MSNDTASTLSAEQAEAVLGQRLCGRVRYLRVFIHAEGVALHGVTANYFGLGLANSATIRRTHPEGSSSISCSQSRTTRKPSPRRAASSFRSHSTFRRGFKPVGGRKRRQSLHGAALAKRGVWPNCLALLGQTPQARNLKAGHPLGRQFSRRRGFGHIARAGQTHRPPSIITNSINNERIRLSAVLKPRLAESSSPNRRRLSWATSHTVGTRARSSHR